MEKVAHDQMQEHFVAWIEHNFSYTLQFCLDLSPAFDVLDHKIFLQKPKCYSFQVSAPMWTESYLTN